VRQIDQFGAEQRDVSFYTTFQFKLGKFGILPGLRFESSSVDWTSRLARTNGKNTYDRTLPSLFITRALNEQSKLKLSYSEGTTPSSLEQLNPSLRYQGEYSGTRGNPQLEPADRRTIEFGYEYNKDELSLVSTLFYRDTRNQIVAFSAREAGNLVISSPVNLGEAVEYGLGSTLKGKVGAKFNYTLDFEVSSHSLSNPSLDISPMPTINSLRQQRGKAMFTALAVSAQDFGPTTSNSPTNSQTRSR
jgi:ferric enterobactin receptor